MQRGNMAYRNGNPAAAVSFYNQALTSPATRAAASFNLGRIALEQGQAEKAKGYFEDAGELEVEYPLVRVYHARSLMALGDKEGAKKDYERVLKGPAFVPEASLDLAKILASEGEYAKAVETVQPAKHSRTLKEEAMLDEAGWRHQMGDLEGAISVLEELLTTHSYRIPTHFQLADYLIESGDYREAERRLRAGLEMQPQNSEAIVKLAETLAKIGKVDEARRFFTAVASSGDPNHPLVKRAQEGLAKLPKPLKP